MPKKIEKPLEELAVLKDFFTHFTLADARDLLHQMFRAAFAQQNQLDKADVLNLLHLKEKIQELIPAAEALADQPAYAYPLVKLFRNRDAGQWLDSLNETFHAAVYDGFFTNPPVDDDIYDSCHGLLRLLNVCCKIYTATSGKNNDADIDTREPLSSTEESVKPPTHVNTNPIYYYNTIINKRPND